jgi:prolyl-tRNA editing enzyme YbaK/EbsC (Cys-tRNA(Pro) deacylase)
MEYHPVTKQIIDLLQQNNCWFQIFEHAPVRTSEEAAKLRPGFTLHQGAKALIVKTQNRQKQKSLAMLVFPADLKFDAKKVKSILGVKDLRFATEEEVASLTAGIQAGGVPPFGNLFNLEVFVDESLFGNEKIIFNAGDRRVSIAMKSEDYRKLVNPNIHHFAA